MVYEDESSKDLSSLDISSSSDDMMYRIPASIDDEDYMGIENSSLDVCSEHGLPPERCVAFEGFETGRRFLVCAQMLKDSGLVGSAVRSVGIDGLLKMQLSYNCCYFLTSGASSDQEWPPTMQNALFKLWEMLEDNKSGRRDDNLGNSLKIHHLTKEKRNLDATYDKLVEDVNQLLNAQEERDMDLSYMKVNAHGAESSSSAVSVMKFEIEKKEAEIVEVKGKYSVLMNLQEAQGRVIRTQKANHLKEKEMLSEENYNLKKKGIENLIKCRDEPKLQIADKLKALEKNQEKLKMIRDILDG
ncbi:hypothetical protein D1007_19305 [Hordeum vulgare]|nr:hypothetical protein D1007_19305 [Hordeum vulgare]